MLVSFLRGWRIHATRKAKTKQFKRRPNAQGLACQNQRDYMEDRASTRLPLLLAVFDGHGGDACSHYMSTRFVNDLHHQVKCYIHQPFTVFRDLLVQDFERQTRLMHLNDAFLSCGSTGVFCFHRVIQKEIVLANIGDSRAIVLDLDIGKVLHSTRDHKPTDPVERQLIHEKGGIVFNKRINGILAVARSFGDFNCTGVHATPDISVFSYASSSDEKKQSITVPKNMAVVLATDGIWDVLKNVQVAAMIKRHWQQRKAEKGTNEWIRDTLQEIQDTAILRGSRDNTTVWIWKCV